MSPSDDSNFVVLKVAHNIEVAHRLLNLPGKCQQIHGHSMWVCLEIYCENSDENGYALGADGTLLDFGSLKEKFRTYLDKVWDHHLHLNASDPWAQNLGIRHNAQGRVLQQEKLPGLQTWPGDPSTENIARWIKDAVEVMLPGTYIAISIEETRTNGVRV